MRTTEEVTKNKEKFIAYNATSPDELALVNGARHLGFAYDGVNEDMMTMIKGWDGPIEYKHLNVIEFNSDRKRMTVFVKNPQGKIMVICKGADSIVAERLRSADEKLKDETFKFLE